MAFRRHTRGYAMLAALQPKDQETLQKLQVPRYDTTKKLTRKEREIAITGFSTTLQKSSTKNKKKPKIWLQDLSEKPQEHLSKKHNGELVAIPEELPKERQRDLSEESPEEPAKEIRKGQLQQPTCVNLTKNKRRWDRKNYCIFCDKLFGNFRRHLLGKHQSEQPVARYMSLMEINSDESKAIRRKIFDELRNKGNSLYNKNILNDPKQQEGNASKLLPARRPPANKKSLVSDYVTCMFCEGLFSKNSFRKHVPRCMDNFKTSEDLSSDIEEDDEDFLSLNARNRKCPNFSKRYGVLPRPHSMEASKQFQEHILPILKKDDSVKLALDDPIIMGIASDFLGNHLNKKCKYIVSRKVHDGGKFLLNIKKRDNTIVGLRDCFHTTKMKAVLDTVKEMCGCDELTGDVEVIGMPARISWILNEGAARAIDDSLCDESLTDEQKEVIKKNINDFLDVKKRRWKYTISTNAEICRIRKKMLKPVVMPQDEDIKTIAGFLKDQEVKLYSALASNKTVTNYENLCEVTISRIMTLSRRRPAEAARAELHHYQARENNDYVSPDILETLSEEEKKALKNLTMFVVPGKNEQQVPVLMTKQIKNNIDLIIKCRSALGIPITNPYLFARPGLDTPFDGTKVLTKLKKLCPGLKKPEHLTATGLRHHCATISQVHGDKYVGYLSKFMGHTSHIHRKSYQLPLGIIQKGVLGKTMLSMEGSSSTETAEVVLEENRQSSDSVTEVDTTVEASTSKARNRWTTTEKSLVINEFKHFILTGTNPGLVKCRELIQKHKALGKRTSAQINTMIDNINKGKLKLPKEFEYLKT